MELSPSESELLPPEVRQILDNFSEVFESPKGLPPRREYDHSIRLMPRATPVAKRPYRIPPHLKDELEKQITEMLESGVIRPSNSPFSSPVIMVKKKDGTWRMVIDYRHLNALTIKAKYPIPIIDELLDELAGAAWFSKLDLRAGYHQIRLAPREEFKTAFQTYIGHFEFTVVAYGLTGAPRTFQGAMNTDLSPTLRKYAVVFFDDILIFSKSYMEYLASVLQIMKEKHWQVKMSKCDFAKQ